MRVMRHLGADKTGTASIQAHLPTRRASQPATGISYRRGDDGQDLRAGSGLKSNANGVAIGTHLQSGRPGLGAIPMVAFSRPVRVTYFHFNP